MENVVSPLQTSKSELQPKQHDVPSMASCSCVKLHSAAAACFHISDRQHTLTISSKLPFFSKSAAWNESGSRLTETHARQCQAILVMMTPLTMVCPGAAIRKDTMTNVRLMHDNEKHGDVAEGDDGDDKQENGGIPASCKVRFPGRA